MPNVTRSKWVDECVAALEAGRDPETLEGSAAALAASDDPSALDALGSFLVRSDFLDHLDPPDPAGTSASLTSVFSSLIGMPGPEVATLCLRLVDEPLYQPHSRRLLVLEALACVTPMSSETAAAFERANDEGYYAFNALRLAKNSSETALALYRSMMSDDAVDIESRVELVHKGILPYRNRLTIVKTAAALIESKVDPLIVRAAIESVFDYQREWFTIHGPTPPLWRTATDEVLRFILQLGSALIDQQKASASLWPAIEETTATVRSLLAARAR